MSDGRKYHLGLLLILGQQLLITTSLHVRPGYIPKAEGDSQVHFFCFESETDSSYATGISWRDPLGNIYTPGSPTEGENERIDVQGSQLSVYDLVRTDSGNYECFRGSESALGTLFVSAPPAIINPMPIQMIYHGITSLLTCQVDRGNPLANITWAHIAPNPSDPANPIFTIITRDYDPRFTVVEDGLQIENVQESDEGEYRCYVNNEYGTRVLDIQAAFRAPPQFLNPAIELDIVLTEGERALLDCAAAGAPSPNHTWSIPPHSQMGQMAPWTGSILDVQVVDGSDAGDYICTVDNGVEIITRTFSIKLAVPPQPVLKYRNLTIVLDQPTQINCSISSALPKPIFRWSNTLTNEPLPEDSWSSVYSNNDTGLSQLTHTFTADDFNPYDCKVVVMCEASNGYGRSEQFFTLSLNSSHECPGGVTSTPSAPSPSTPSQSTSSPGTSSPNPPSISTADEQGLEDNGENSMDDTTFKIILAVIAIALTCIVVGVSILFIYFLKHFCCKNRKSSHSVEKPPYKPRNDPTMSSLHHQQFPGGVDTGRQVSVESGSSVNSGASVSSMQSLLPQTHRCGDTTHQTHIPPQDAVTSPRSFSNQCSDGVYSRLNHNIPPSNSIGPTQPQRTVRLSSSSSANSTIPLLPQPTGGDLESSTTSTTGSVFFTNNLTDGGGGGVSPGLRPPLPRRQPSSSSTTSNLRENCRAGNHNFQNSADSDGMQINLAYESLKQKFSSSSSDNAPHIYETIA